MDSFTSTFLFDRQLGRAIGRGAHAPGVQQSEARESHIPVGKLRHGWIRMDG